MKKVLSVSLLLAGTLALTSCGLGTEVSREEFKTQLDAKKSFEESGFTKLVISGNAESVTTIAGHSANASITIDEEYSVSSNFDFTTIKDNSEGTGYSLVLSLDIEIMFASVSLQSNISYYLDGASFAMKESSTASKDGSTITSDAEIKWNEFGLLSYVKSSLKIENSSVSTITNTTCEFKWSK